MHAVFNRKLKSFSADVWGRLVFSGLRRWTSICVIIIFTKNGRNSEIFQMGQSC